MSAAPTSLHPHACCGPWLLLTKLRLQGPARAGPTGLSNSVLLFAPIRLIWSVFCLSWSPCVGPPAEGRPLCCPPPGGLLTLACPSDLSPGSHLLTRALTGYPPLSTRHGICHCWVWRFASSLSFFLACGLCEGWFRVGPWHVAGTVSVGCPTDSQTMAACTYFILTRFHLCSHHPEPTPGAVPRLSSSRLLPCPKPGSLGPDPGHVGRLGALPLLGPGPPPVLCSWISQAWGLEPGPVKGLSCRQGLTRTHASGWKKEQEPRVLTERSRGHPERLSGRREVWKSGRISASEWD